MTWYAGNNSTNNGSLGWLFQTGATTQTLLPGLYTNTQTFFSPTVTAQASNLFPNLYTNTQTFYSPTLTIINDIRPGLYTNEQVFFPALIYNLYPDPSQVLAGVVYGPGGVFVGTLTLNPPEPRISLRTFTGRF